ICKRGKRHAERSIEEPVLCHRDLTKKRCSSSSMACSSSFLALTDLHSSRRQKDQSLQEQSKGLASVRRPPNRLPGIMSFPVITVVEEVGSPAEGFRVQ